ncbi:hypothetical protein BAUCODRAFT_47144, partial [Baudoinia panamericana UAMH 10762]
RLATELALLEAMYPDQLHFAEKAREMNYRADTNALVLRLPDGYPGIELPQVLSANAGKIDVRERLKRRIGELIKGEELLDTILAIFNELVDDVGQHGSDHAEQSEQAKALQRREPDTKATIIVWLHHLLNTNKRKLALSPASSAVSGITKPGYPGVLIYTGPANAVHEHVIELKSQNWQAFQVRFESDEEWSFAHGQGVREVEAMKDVVADVG